MPPDTRDDVVEKFLSKILPGSGTVYRAPDRHTATATSTTSSSSATSSSATIINGSVHDDNRTSSTPRRAAATSSSASRLDTAGSSSKQQQQQQQRRSRRRRVCKSVPLDAERHRSAGVELKTVCFHVTDQHDRHTHARP